MEKTADDPHAEPMHIRLVAARLLTLLRLLRESAIPEYERNVGLNELNRQLMIMIGGCGGLSSNELVAFTGHEKAQISRAVKALEIGGLIERASLRAKLTLRPDGEQLFSTIMAVGRARDAALTAGMTASERKAFVATTKALIVRAAQVYAEERSLSADESQAPPPIPDYDEVPDKHGIGKLIAPQLQALVSYIRRSAMLVYQREQGLSNFQWMILSQIGEYQPLPLARLIEIMGRDKSQVGRTVAYFEEQGLIERQRVARKRDIMVMTTPKGAEVYREMCVIAIHRDETLTGVLAPGERTTFIGHLDRLEANARRMVARQKGNARG